MGQDQSNIANKEHQVQTKQKAKLDDIVVVSQVNSKVEQTEDDDIKKLKKLKLSKPIFQEYIGEIEYTNIPKINAGPLSEMILRYQFHMTECAEVVSFDQNVLSKRIKDVDHLALSVYKTANERQKYLDTAISQIKKSTEVRFLMERIEATLQNTKLQFQKLNNMLPEEERIMDNDFFDDISSQT